MAQSSGEAERKAERPWRNAPKRTIVVFLLAVFFVFASIGFVNDVFAMGRQPMNRFVVTIVMNGLLAVCYASAGIVLRHRFWVVFVPVFTVQVVAMTMLGHWMPDAPRFAEYSVQQTADLTNRLALDGSGVIAFVMLGYAGFVWTSVSEGRRYARLQVEKAALDSEMAAAREIQQVMVPEDLPPTPGFRVEGVYLPAAQVGGDFFQVIPVRSGRTVLVLGDVSGKGLSAAMIVSMLVGMLRTIVAFTEEPAEILAELNRKLLGRTHGGFATCLVVCLEPSGELSIASAGHLSPYLNGAEVALPGSLPLGVVEQVTYEQASLALSGADRLFLVTDGVVEAQDEQGRLLGFDRLEWLLRDGATAHGVAEAAQQHGQTDDITAIAIEPSPILAGLGGGR